MNQSQKVVQLVASKVALSQFGSPGDYATLHEKLCLDLSKAYQQQENPDHWCISWANQVKAQDYFNEHGFVDTLNHLTELQGRFATLMVN